MPYRTDLAIETKKNFGSKDGIEKSVKKEQDIEIISIKIKTKKAANEVKKPVGRYITLQHAEILKSYNVDSAEEILVKEIKKFIKKKETVLLVGLGNKEITSDSIGPLVSDRVVVTRQLDKNLKKIFGFEDLRTVSSIAPGVFGKTGIESTEIVKACCEIVKPEIVVVVDALAAADIKRLGTTIQLTNTGICPGSGVQNKRKELSKNVLGVPVLAIGVPTVVDVEDIKKKAKNQNKEPMILTLKNIDLVAKRSAKLIANALNRAFFPTLEKEELKAFYDWKQVVIFLMFYFILLKDKVSFKGVLNLKKLFLKYGKSKTIVGGPLIILVGILIFVLVPSLARALNKVAVFSTKINFLKNVGFKDCFKQTEHDQRNFNALPHSKETPVVENKEPQEEEKGPIVRRQFEPLKSNKFVNIGGTAFVRNMTSLSNNVIINANKRKPPFNITTTTKPQVLIYHTHTTECYEAVEKDSYEKKVPTRSKDSNLNVVGVGNEIVKQLEVRGIKTIHDTKIYDDPAYSGAYDRTNTMIQKTLRENPDIKVVLDIHRDSMTNKEKQRIAPVTTVNGKKVAQLMIISGCDNGTGNYKTYEKNLTFACGLENQIEKDFPKLTRPVSFKYKHYNQSLSPGALLVEVGSQANSVEEAKLCGTYFGTSLANYLIKSRVLADSNPKTNLQNKPVVQKNQQPKKKRTKKKLTKKKVGKKKWSIK